LRLRKVFKVFWEKDIMADSEGPNEVYDAVVTNSWKVDDNGLYMKAYEIEFRDRQDEVKYQWEESKLPLQRIRQKVKGLVAGLEKPHLPTLVTIFPHIITLYSPGYPKDPNEKETNFMRRGTAKTPYLEDMTLRESTGSMGCAIEVEQIVPSESRLLNRVGPEGWINVFAVYIGYRHAIPNSNKIYQFIQRREGI